jgi:acetolactate synthase-1/2/3 large subunit
VVASAHQLLGALAERLDGRVPVRRNLAVTGIERQVLAPSQQRGLIAPQQAIRELQAVLPRNTIYTVDSGEHFAFAVQFLETTHPDSFLVMTGLGSMGQSIGAAIGAQLSHPDRSVAAICGDGCFAMNAFEIATAVAERLPIRVFVFNDERLGMVEIGHKNVYGRSPVFGTVPLDICSIARGLGAITARIDGPGQLAALEQVLCTATGPVVIDVKIDPTIHMMKKDRVGNMMTKRSAPLPAPLPTPSSDGLVKIVN